MFRCRSNKKKELIEIEELPFLGKQTKINTQL